MNKSSIDTAFVKFLYDDNVNHNIKKAMDESIIVAVTNKDGTITYVNDKFCKISKYSKEELLGKNHRILKSGFHPPEFYGHIWKTISKGQTWRGEINNKAKDGSFYWVKTVIVPVLSKDGKREYVAIRTEITAKKKLEYELQNKLKSSKDLLQERFNVEQAKSEFLSMITHELKTPLTPILAYLPALLDENIMGKLSERQHKTIETIFSNAKQLQKIIDDIFYLQKLELGEIKFDFHTFLVEEIIQRVIDNFSFDKNITFVKKVPESLTIESDFHRIEQILNNLINNAIKFIDPNNGIIEIRAEEKDNFIHFCVRDNGSGIPIEKQKNLFKKFYQVDTSHTREFGGTGLGLSICKHTVEQLGGTIGVESEINIGSNFYFDLPNNK